MNWALLCLVVGILACASASPVQLHFDLYNTWPSHTEFAGPTPTGKEAFGVASPYGYNRHVYPIMGPSLPKGVSIPSRIQKKTEKVIRKWGYLTPWFSVDSFGLDKASPVIPDGFELEELHYLQRHGARYPTSGSGVVRTSQKIENGSLAAFDELAFLNSWTYSLGAEILTPFGRQQCYTLGASYRIRYGSLLDRLVRKPVFRTTSQDRMYKTALNFLAGFFGIPYENQVNLQVIIEAGGFNNTLTPSDTCTNLYKPHLSRAGEAQRTWRSIYLREPTDRINKLVDGLEFTVDDIHNFLELCGYETVALGGSPFCALFTDEEFDGFEYEMDLGFYYGASFGHPVSAAAGLGWAQEWISRVTKSRITEFNSTTNATLHTDEYFPLDQPIYVDFTHDTTLSASMFPVLTPVITTLNLTALAEDTPLPYDHIPSDRSFIVSKITPFATNLQSQTLVKDGTRYVRWILNDGVIPIDNMIGCPYDENGLCELDTYVSALRERLATIDYTDDCCMCITDSRRILFSRYRAYSRWASSLIFEQSNLYLPFLGIFPPFSYFFFH